MSERDGGTMAVEPLRGSPSTPSRRAARWDLSFCRFSSRRELVMKPGTNLQQHPARTAWIPPRAFQELSTLAHRQEEGDTFTPKIILKTQMLCRGHPSLLTVKVPAHIPSLAAPTTAAALAAAAGACRARGRPPHHAHLLPRCETSHVRVLHQPPTGHTCRRTLVDSINREGGLIQTPLL